MGAGSKTKTCLKTLAAITAVGASGLSLLAAQLDKAGAGPVWVSHRAGLISGLSIAVMIGLATAAYAIVSKAFDKRGAKLSVLKQDHAMLQTLVDGLGDGVMVKDLNDKVISVNPQMGLMLGRSKEQVLGHTERELFPMEGVEALFQLDLEVVRTGATKAIDLKSPNGKRSWHLNRFPCRNAEGAITGLVAVVRDVTERKQQEDARVTESALLLQLGELLQMARSLEEAYEVTGEILPSFFPKVSGKICLIHPSHNVVETRASWGELEGGGEDVFEMSDCWGLRRGQPHTAGSAAGAGLRCKHARESAKESACLPLVANGELLGILHLDGAEALDAQTHRRAAMVSEHLALALSNLKLAERLRHQSTRDPLTGLFNRRYMEETLERELRRAERTHEPVGLLMIDADHFKQFNDRFGHDAGDLVLKEIAAVLNRRTRASDIVSRMGGEELLVVLPGASLDQAAKKAEEVRQAIERLQVSHQGNALGQVTVSIGVSASPPHGSSPAELLKIADQAMYRAKHGGRNRVWVANEEPEQRLRRVV